MDHFSRDGFASKRRDEGKEEKKVKSELKEHLEDPKTLAELAKNTGVNLGKLAKEVTELEGQGLVKAEGQPGERKYRWITNVTK